MGVSFAAELLVFSQLSQWTQGMIDRGQIRLPGSVPASVDPRTALSAETPDAAVGRLAGNWAALLVTLAMLVLIVLGKALWRLGVILPRQELAFGRKTWLGHGLMWKISHVSKYWDLIAQLPMPLGLPWVFRRTRKTMPGLVIPLVTDGAG